MRERFTGAERSGRGLIGVMRFKLIQLKIIIPPLCAVKHAKRNCAAVQNTLGARYNGRARVEAERASRASTEFLTDARTSRDFFPDAAM